MIELKKGAGKKKYLPAINILEAQVVQKVDNTNNQIKSG